MTFSSNSNWELKMLKEAPKLNDDIAISGEIKTWLYDANGNDAER